MYASERNQIAVALVLLLVASIGGCAGPSKLFSLDNTWPWKDDENEPQLPNRVVGMWTDTVLHKAGEKPQRGFGGRLMFYGPATDKPVLVDGELVVYAFDETGREPGNNKPTRKYVFPAGQMTTHQSASPLGPSYSFWLPWDEAGGPQTEVSLICRFQPMGGSVVIGEQTSHMLPGAMSAGAVAGQLHPKLPEGVPRRPANPELSSQLSRAPAAGGAQQASYEVAANVTPAVAMQDAATSAPVRQMTATSIALPKDFQIPHGTPSSAVRQIVPPGQFTPQLANAPQAGAATQASPAATQDSTSTQASRSHMAYQPIDRSVRPAVYSPTYSPAPAGPGFGQQPVPVSLAPPTIVPPHLPLPPAQAMQQMVQQMPQQTLQQTLQPMGATVPTTPAQAGPQAMQIPTSGTASVTYR